MRMRLTLFFPLLFLLLLPSCGGAGRLLKARPAGFSPFFEQPWLARPGGGHLPFQHVWTTPDRAVLAAGMARRRLHIAPVTLHYLRPVNRALSAQQIAWGTRRLEAEIAERLRQEFIAAFRRSPRPFYRLAERPGADTLTLQMALIEVNPTSPAGNAVTTVLKVVLTPLAALGKHFTKGNIAIEGKIVDSTSGRAFFQFADNESDKLTFLNARDYQPYGHAVHTLRDWAVQFELMTRSPQGQRVPDSGAITLLPY